MKKEKLTWSNIPASRTEHDGSPSAASTFAHGEPAGQESAQGENLIKAVEFLQQGQPALAESTLRAVLSEDPNNFDALNLLGSACCELRQYATGIGFFEQALELNPQSANTYNNLGAAQFALQRHEGAVASYRRAIEIRPDYAAAHGNLGNALYALELKEEAIASYRRAIELRPEDVIALSNLGNALYDLERYVEAIDSYRRMLAIDPVFPGGFSHTALVSRMICDWSDHAETSSELIEHVRQSRSIVGPLEFISFSDSPADQLRCASHFTQFTLGSIDTAVTQKASRGDERIRIAYLSGDFREHPDSHQMAKLLELHDRDKFEVIGISSRPDDNSAIRARLEEAFDRFVDIREVDDRSAAEMIADLKVHIAVNLSGCTLNSRPGILAFRPAPVQVNYLGFPGTMGCGFIDYILVDPFVVPQDQQPHFSERLVHLPDCYMATDDERAISDHTPSRAESGLPEDGFVFCCFNHSYMITPEMFDLWMRLLNSVPGSVLWLSSEAQAGEDNLRREADARGIEPERIIFANHAPATPDHLARLKLADLFLDTLPNSAHASVCDALWAGLPMISCPGRTFAGRGAGSLLHAIGMPELVTDSLEAYEALALKLAREPELLTKVRDKLARNRTTTALFDSERFCRNLEAAYVKMFETWREGEAPKPFVVDATASST